MSGDSKDHQHQQQQQLPELLLCHTVLSPSRRVGRIDYDPATGLHSLTLESVNSSTNNTIVTYPLQGSSVEPDRNNSTRWKLIIRQPGGKIVKLSLGTTSPTKTNTWVTRLRSASQAIDVEPTPRNISTTVKPMIMADTMPRRSQSPPLSAPPRGDSSVRARSVTPRSTTPRRTVTIPPNSSSHHRLESIVTRPRPTPSIHWKQFESKFTPILPHDSVFEANLAGTPLDAASVTASQEDAKNIQLEWLRDAASLAPINADFHKTLSDRQFCRDGIRPRPVLKSGVALSATPTTTNGTTADYITPHAPEPEILQWEGPDTHGRVRSLLKQGRVCVFWIAPNRVTWNSTPPFVLPGCREDTSVRQWYLAWHQANNPEAATNFHVTKAVDIGGNEDELRKANFCAVEQQRYTEATRVIAPHATVGFVALYYMLRTRDFTRPGAADREEDAEDRDDDEDDDESTNGTRPTYGCMIWTCQPTKKAWKPRGSEERVRTALMTWLDNSGIIPKIHRKVNVFKSKSAADWIPESNTTSYIQCFESGMQPVSKITRSLSMGYETLIASSPQYAETIIVNNTLVNVQDLFQNADSLVLDQGYCLQFILRPSSSQLVCNVFGDGAIPHDVLGGSLLSSTWDRYNALSRAVPDIVQPALVAGLMNYEQLRWNECITKLSTECIMTGCTIVYRMLKQPRASDTGPVWIHVVVEWSINPDDGKKGDKVETMGGGASYIERLKQWIETLLHETTTSAGPSVDATSSPPLSKIHFLRIPVYITSGDMKLARLAAMSKLTYVNTYYSAFGMMPGCVECPASLDGNRQVSPLPATPSHHSSKSALSHELAPEDALSIGNSSGTLRDPPALDVLKKLSGDINAEITDSKSGASHDDLYPFDNIAEALFIMKVTGQIVTSLEHSMRPSRPSYDRCMIAIHAAIQRSSTDHHRRLIELYQSKAFELALNAVFSSKQWATTTTGGSDAMPHK